MRILHVIPDLSLEGGGPVAALIGQSEAEAREGHEVIVASTDWASKNPPTIPGVDVRVFPCLLENWRFSPGLASFIGAIIRNIDIVIVENLWQFPTFISAYHAQRTGCPYIVSLNGMLAPWSINHKAWKKRPYLRLIEGPILRKAAAIHSATLGEHIDSKSDRWNRSCFVLALGIRPSQYTPLSDPEQLWGRFPFLKDKRIVLFVGRLHPIKQPDTLIRAFGSISNQDPDANLVLVGPGPQHYVQYLESIVRENKLESKVHLIGKLEGGALAEIYRRATMTVVPSWQENFGMVVIESMANGCPVVISDKVCLAPEVKNAHAGIIVAPYQQAIADGMVVLMHNERLRVEMSENARALAVAKYTWNGVIPEYIRVYRDVIERTRTSENWVVATK